MMSNLIGFPLSVFMKINLCYPFFQITEKWLCVLIPSFFPGVSASFKASVYPRFDIIGHFPKSSNLYFEDGTAVFYTGRLVPI
jgi:hypothetical protein